MHLEEFTNQKDYNLSDTGAADSSKPSNAIRCNDKAVEVEPRLKENDDARNQNP
jgi:hypothetical protein